LLRLAALARLPLQVCARGPAESGGDRGAGAGRLNGSSRCHQPCATRRHIQHGPGAAYNAWYFARFYGASRFHAAGDKPVVNWALSRMLRRLCERNGRGGGRPALVHFGCGQGFLAKACGHWSSNVGCDIALFAAGSARANGVASVCAALERAAFGPGPSTRRRRLTFWST